MASLSHVQNVLIYKMFTIQLLSPKMLRVLFRALLSFIIIAIFLRSPFSNYEYSIQRPPTFTGQGTVPGGPHQDVLDGLDWSRFAYVQYVTNTEHLCNSVMLFEALHRLGSRADRLMMYPSNFAIDSEDDSSDGVLLRKARDMYGVKLVPIEIQRRTGSER